MFPARTVMKKKLLKPPSNHGEILFLPDRERFSHALQGGGLLSTCHQLQFFQPGVGARFLLVDMIRGNNKRIVFMDTDRTDLRVRIPWFGETPTVFNLMMSERPLYTFTSIDTEQLKVFFDEIEAHLSKGAGDAAAECIGEYRRFSRILLTQPQSLSLRERLAEAFVSWGNIETNYVFLSELLEGKAFKAFAERIFSESERFRDVYNRSIDAFKEQFRFRFKNYPFAKLKRGELPFWVVRDRRRHTLNTDTVDLSDMKRYAIIPKASPLTLFLRQHESGIFVHGVGGANYEWINDRVLKHFYKTDPRPFFVMSATFHRCGIPDREYAYFFMNPNHVRSAVMDYFHERGSNIVP
jgi:hypothetical protein